MAETDLHILVFHDFSDIHVQRAERLQHVGQRLENMCDNFDVRKLAARMNDDQSESYILCGWMGEEDVEAFVRFVRYKMPPPKNRQSPCPTSPNMAPKMNV